MLESMNDVYGSTLCDYTHKGPNQAGNKSLLSYRADIGVPGYTGFIPGPATIVVPTKNFQHTGKPVDNVIRDTYALKTVDAKAYNSEYGDCYRKLPTDTSPCSKTGGGYWLSQRSPGVKPPFIAKSTYQQEVLDSANTAAQQLERSVGLSCTLANYEAARKTAPRAQSAEPSIRHTNKLPLDATARPATAVTSLGELVGYQTTTSSMVIKSPLTGGPAAAGLLTSKQQSRSETCSPPGDARYATMPRAMAPTMHGAHSSYIRDFGQDCSDPMERSAPGEKFMTRMATAKELSDGTTRNTSNIPGYTGHCSAFHYNKLARAQSDNPDERIDSKQDMLLYHLDQYSRTRLPHYTGYKPQAPRNITLEQPSQGPTILTTSGAANFDGTKRGVPHQEHTHYINSRTGLMAFFEEGKEAVSDNGLANAQVYYKLVRPGDGRFKMAQPSKATTYGAPFRNSTSLV